MLDQMLAFIREHQLCVLATCDGREPHASLMAYLPGEQGRQIYLLTSVETRKYRNIMANPAVSLLVEERQNADPGPGLKALTVGGVCTPAPAARQDELKERFARSLPLLADITNDPAAKVLEVRVRALQLLDGPTRSSYVELD